MLKPRFVKTLTDAAERIDTYSVYDRRNVSRYVKGRMARLPSNYRDKAAYGMDNDRVDRRDFLKLLGMGGVSAVAGTGMLKLFQSMEHETVLGYAAADGSNYETITVPASGDTKRIRGGEEWTNKLIDQTSGGDYVVHASGDDWVIRDIGWLGMGPPDDGHHHFNVAGHGVVENLFFDGRARSGTDGTDMGCVRLKRGHSGKVELRHSFIAGTGNNASYASSAGKNGGGDGAMIYRNCYHRDCTPSNYRPGTPGSRVINCVGIADDPEGLRGEYPHSGKQGCRSVWANHHKDIVARNVAIYHTERDVNTNQAFEAREISKSNSNRCELTLEDCHINPDFPTRKFVERGNAEIFGKNDVGSNPTVQVIQNGGVPLNPEMAAMGLRAMPPEVDNIVPPGGMDADGQPYEPAYGPGIGETGGGTVPC